MIGAFRSRSSNTASLESVAALAAASRARTRTRAVVLGVPPGVSQVYVPLFAMPAAIVVHGAAPVSE